MTELSEPTDDFDVVLLIEEALSQQDAAQVRSLHEGIDVAVTYHVVLPVDDAAAQVEASLGSMGGNDMLGTPGLGSPGLGGSGLDLEDLERLRDESRTRAEADLATSLEALRQAGADASGEITVDDPVDALEQLIAKVDGREAIVLTRPHVVAEFFHVDWSHRARRRLGVPVLHLLERENFDEQAGEGEGVTGV